MPSDPEEAARLIRSCQGLVRSLAWKMHQRLPASVDLDDLIGYGQIGLAEAARDFDPERGVQFTTYSYYRIRGAIMDGLSQMSWFRRAEYASGRYEAAANQVLSTADAAGDDAPWFSRTTGALGAAFILTHFSGENGDIPQPTGNTEDCSAETGELQETIHRVIGELPEKEQAIIRGVYFDGLSIKEAGDRLSISKAWASRLHSRALELLSFQLLALAD